jgi:hypothetical protein
MQASVAGLLRQAKTLPCQLAEAKYLFSAGLPARRASPRRGKKA